MPISLSSTPSPDTRQQSCHQALGRGSLGRDGAQGAPFPLIFSPGLMQSLLSVAAAQGASCAWVGNVLVREFHRSPASPGTGAELGLWGSHPLRFSHRAFTSRWLQVVGHVCRASSTLACPKCQTSNNRAGGQVRGPAASLQPGPGPTSRQVQEVSMKQECPSPPFPLWLLPPSLPAHKPGCASVSLPGTSEGTENPVKRRGAELGGGR